MSLAGFLVSITTVRQCCFGAILPTASLYEARANFQRLTRGERNNYLYRSLDLAYEAATDKFRFKIAGWSLCKECYSSLIGISGETLNNRIREYHSGQRTWTQGLGGVGRGPSSFEAMTKYFEQVATPTPDSGLKHLPGGMSKLEVFQDIISDMGFDELSPPISLSWFRTVWKREFADVITLKQARMGKCSDCELFRVGLASATGEHKIALAKERAEHIRAVRQDRGLYQTRRLEAAKGSKYLVLIHDGMDQNKTVLPAAEEGGVKFRVLYISSRHVLLPTRIRTSRQSGECSKHSYGPGNNSLVCCTFRWTIVPKIKKIISFYAFWCGSLRQLFLRG